MSVSRVVGIDPGFACLGWGVIEFDGPHERLIAMGVLRTQKAEKKRKVLASDDNVRRARLLSHELAWLLSTHRARAICAESMSFPRSSSIAAKMAMVWGVVASLADERSLPIVQASPKEIKRSVVGNAAASKEDVEAAVSARFSNAPSLTNELAKSLHEHAFDAVAAIAACAGSDVILAVRGRQS